MNNSKSPNTEPTKTLAYSPDRWNGELRDIGGSQSDEWNNFLANQALNALWLKNSDDQTRHKQASATIAALVGIEPKDELEGMMAAQLIAAHNAAMECYRRAMIGEQSFEGRRENLAQANKLSRTYALLLEALNRHRGKGQQKVTVEHVHVHEGGQAIIGNVEGGGGCTKLEDQPHALEYAPGEALRSQDAEREVLPIASDAERSLPDARRTVSGRSQGK